jgi:hypothetical protein
MRSVIDNPMGKYAQVAKQLENPAIKLDMLAKYAQGQNPAVPEFLALAEIKRRQELNQHSPQPAPTTVQEDLVRAAAPQPMQQMPQQMAGLPAMQRPQGVAALPTGMGEQSFAGGGIIAFAGDGPQGSQVEDPDAGLGYFERFKRYVNNLGGTPMDRYGNPLKADNTPLKKGDLAVNATPLEIQGVRTGQMVKGADPAGWNDGTANKGTRLADNTYAPDLGNLSAGPTQAERDAFYEKSKSKSDKDTGTEPKSPKEDMYAKYEEMLKGQAAESKAGRQQDKYMRLLEAGLGIMGGTSPFASVNLCQGAMGAAKGYAQDQAGYRKEDRENIKELMGLGMKREEAEREAEKLSMTKDLYAAHGKYYNAMANAAGVRAAGAGTAGMDKANLAAITRTHANLLKDAKEFDSPYHGKSAAELYQIAQQLVLQQGGGSAAPVVAGTYSLKGGYSPAGS